MSVVRNFRATNVSEALALVRAELGEDALVLGRRDVRRRPFPWWKVVVEAEVTAAIAPEFVRTIAQAAPFPPGESTVEAPSRVNPSSESGMLAAAPSAESAQSSPPHPASLNDPFHVYTQLIELEVEESVARELLAEAQRGPAEKGDADGRLALRCRRRLQANLTCTGPIRVTPGRRRIAALVGPTGVGKTTTVAKLAANFRLRDRVRVGLITVDTYRVAAVEQLRTYAELIDIPMYVVSTPREMPAALDELADVDLVLIDTAGRSPGDDLRIQELRSFLQAARADEVHLVTSLAAGTRHLKTTVDRFGRVSPTALLLTKLDEAAGPGAVVSAARLAELPLSYITTGQDVPDDIETADAKVIADRVLPSETG